MNILLTFEANEILEAKRVGAGRTNLPKDDPECLAGSPLQPDSLLIRERKDFRT